MLTLALAASGSAASTPQTGAALTQQVLSGQLGCSKLTATQFGLIGDYLMSRMLGSSAADQAMEAHMRAVWGASGLQQAYRFMGQRLAGCATGYGPRAFGTMMGMTGAGMMGASYGYGTAGYGSGAYAPGYMMGGRYGPGMMGYPYQSRGGSGMSAGAIVAIVLGGLALLSLAIFAGTRFGRLPPRPAEPHGT